MIQYTAIPNRNEVVSTEPCGDSAWSMSTARIVTRNSDGTIHDYFVKVTNQPHCVVNVR